MSSYDESQLMLSETNMNAEEHKVSGGYAFPENFDLPSFTKSSQYNDLPGIPTEFAVSEPMTKTEGYPYMAEAADGFYLDSAENAQDLAANAD